MNPIFKIILDILHISSDEERRRRELQARAQAESEPRVCPVCKAEAGEHVTECPSCGARLD
ncbi:MAG: hypothetical protein AB1916_08365 [Thermodesulfobacteriota bacterium]